MKNNSNMKTTSNTKTILNVPNQTYQTEPAKENLKKQTHQIKSTKGSLRIKKCHKKWKKSTSQQKTSKSPKFVFGLFDKRGGEAIFSFFSQM